MLCPAVFLKSGTGAIFGSGEIGGGSESRSSRAVGFVGCNQHVESADCWFFQHLAAPVAPIRDVEPALLDVQDAPDVERVILAVQRRFQEDQIFGGRRADGMAKAIL